MLGLNRITGRPLSGWDHVVQSLNVLFTTKYHERVMLRYFGSAVPQSLGSNMTERTLLSVIYSAVLAIDLWEPRFRVVSVNLNQANRQGQVGFEIDGIYYPNGQIGDYTNWKKQALLILARNTGLVALPNSEVKS